ncbi:fibronectin type III-like domain-contianing protein [Hymenobacter properus]|uniref:Fibronectin type III-like domain-contianing protein n=1 Tax=Hymenobacter properus TaxID=2791026 RepID=A0A931BGZ1_9BACT|nr:fibronectin type III-like domain-contianing protein [Hymenobacter properus]MBF9141446.1 fibronectin type III-like domain-contianing protein [Hymenobacter properus]MBR7720255.1 fibronectin type III-like domain-contianing protein [Microvirga sp. SRT04]
MSTGLLLASLLGHSLTAQAAPEDTLVVNPAQQAIYLDENHYSMLAKAAMPQKQLKAFERINRAPQQKKTVTFSLTAEAIYPGTSKATPASAGSSRCINS